MRTVTPPAPASVPAKSLVGRGEPAARRARARRSAEQTLAARHADELAALQTAAAAARRGPASARTELIDTYAEEYAALLHEAETAEGLSGFQSGYTPSASGGTASAGSDGAEASDGLVDGAEASDGLVDGRGGADHEDGGDGADQTGHPNATADPGPVPAGNASPAEAGTEPSAGYGRAEVDAY